jgi:hypothetical protein
MKHGYIQPPLDSPFVFGEFSHAIKIFAGQNMGVTIYFSHLKISFNNLPRNQVG